MAEMTINDYARYVLNNIGRATLSNAMKITEKLDTTYSFKDFLLSIQSYTTQTINENRFDTNVVYGILYVTNKALTKYTSSIKYTKSFIISDYIIDLWKVINGL